MAGPPEGCPAIHAQVRWGFVGETIYLLHGTVSSPCTSCIRARILLGFNRSGDAGPAAEAAGALHHLNVFRARADSVRCPAELLNAVSQT